MSAIQPIQTRVWRVNSQMLDAEGVEGDESRANIRQAADILRGGGLVAFPTETVYGLGANALDADAVVGIYVAKGRPSRNPIIVHVADVAAAQALVSEWPETAARLAARFWPGPLTLVLPKNPALPDIVTGGGPTVGIRIPAHPVALALLRAASLPIAAPSANLSEHLSPTRAEHVLTDLNERIDAVLDSGPTSGGLESTVLNLTTKRPTLLRPGLVTPAEIEAVIGPIWRRTVSMSASEDEVPLAAPGMLARHYAPRAPLEVIHTLLVGHVNELLARGEVVGWLTTRTEAFMPGLRTLREATDVHRIEMPTEPEAYSAVLYARLHELDAQGVTYILVDAVPESEAWLAVRDRLQRAAMNTPEQRPEDISRK